MYLHNNLKDYNTLWSLLLIWQIYLLKAHILNEISILLLNELHFELNLIIKEHNITKEEENKEIMDKKDKCEKEDNVYFQDTNIKVFKGNYIKGKKNGKGKEYYINKKKKFEGEYFNGERNGKGIRYDYEGEILFEGIYLNGEKWTGKGKEYYTDHDDEDDTDENPFKNMIFNVGKKKKKKSELGFFLGDLGNKNLTRITLNNFGLPQAKKVLKFEGEYLNGLRHGKGKEYNKDKQLIYEGDYLYGKWDGQGKQYYSSYLGKEQLLYEGEFKDGQWDGVGKQYKTGITPGGIEKEGIFEKGKFIEYMKVD